MKINIEIDLTPEEARELMGMPSIDRMQTYFNEAVKGQWKDDTNPFVVMWDAFMKQSKDAFDMATKVTDKGAPKKTDKP